MEQRKIILLLGASLILLALFSFAPAVFATGTTVTVNGKSVNVTVEPRTTLLEVLRYQLDLTGAKPVSMDGSSGASTAVGYPGGGVARRGAAGGGA